MGEAGDLYIKVNILKDKEFEIKGHDIVTTKKLTIFEAILGGNIQIDTLHGKKDIKIKEGTQSNSIKTVSGLGIPSDTFTGDLKGILSK